MAELHQEFAISRKVVATTTNNGAKYASAFNQFGVTEGGSDRETEEDDEVVEPTPILVEEALDHHSLLPKRRGYGLTRRTCWRLRPQKRFLAGLLLPGQPSPM